MDNEGEAKNQEVVKPPLSTDSGQMTFGEHEGEIVQKLSKWFHRPLSDLPQDPREIAVAYIPTWSDLSPAERQACAVIEDGKLRARIGSRYEQARREQDGPADYCQFLTGFNSVRNPKPPAKRQQFELSDARCIELARMPSLGLAEWLELTGAGVGEYLRFEVTLDGVRFIKYTAEDMTSGSIEWQIQMARYNDLKPLIWPCSPADILEFTDSEPFEIFAFFPVRDAFRRTVVETLLSVTHKATSDAGGNIRLKERSEGAPEDWREAPQDGIDEIAIVMSEFEDVINASPLLEDVQKMAETPNNDTDGLVSWQGATLEAWEDIVKHYGKGVSGRTAMSWLKKYGSRDVFGCVQQNHNSLRWRDISGEEHPLGIRGFCNQLSRWRKAGKIPKRK